MIPALFTTLFFLFLSSDAFAGFYTIQTGSFLHKRLRSAERMYDMLSNRLSPEERDYLRIEKGKRYYIVRVGRFGSLSEARPLLKKLRKRFHDSFVLYQRDDIRERYHRLFEGTALKTSSQPGATPSSTSSISYSIQTGRYLKVDQAVRELNGLIKALGDEVGGSIEIVKDGQYFAVRVGEFSSYEEAERFLRKHRASLTGIIVKVSDDKRTASSRVENQTEGPGKGDSEFLSDTDTARSGENPALTRKLKEISTEYYNGEFGKAAGLIREALRRWPDNSDLHAWYGATLLNMDYPVKAYRQYKKAIDIAPDVPDYHAGAGYSLMNISMKRIRQSIDAFNKALDIDPENPSALEGLGTVYVSINRADRAMEIYHKLKELDPEAADRLYNLIQQGVNIEK